MKKLILLSCLVFSALFITILPAGAHDYTYSGNLYFDNTNTHWTNIKVCMGWATYRALFEPDANFTNNTITRFYLSGSKYGDGLYIIDTDLPATTGERGNYWFYKETEQNTTQSLDDEYYQRGLVITPTGPNYSSTEMVDSYYPGIAFELRPLPLLTLTLTDATNATNIYGGEGTAQDPFIVLKNENVSCSAGCTFYDDPYTAQHYPYTQEPQYTFENTGETSGNQGTIALGTNTATYTFTPSETGEFQISYNALNHTNISISELGTHTVYPDSRTDACATTIYYKAIDKLEIASSGSYTAAPEEGDYADISVTRTYDSNEIYQFVSMPFDVTKIEIKDATASDFSSVIIGTGTSNARILTYNTATRASGTRDGSEWNDITSPTLDKGVGYMIGFGSDFTAPMEVRYSMSSYANVSHDSYTNTLAEHLTTTTVPDDSNWNLIGLNQWGTGSISGPTVIGIPKTTSIGYFYDINGVDVEAEDLDPYSAFFVQYSGDVTSTLTTTTPDEIRAQSPQASSQNGQEYYIFNISGTSADNTARAAVCLDPNGSEDYVAGSDFPNLNGAGTCALFTTLNAKDYFLNNVPDTTTTLSLNAMLTADETYTISMDDRSNSAVNVWLVDHVLNTTTDLKVNDYSFTGTTGAVQGRFTVQIAKTQQIPTGNNNQSASELEVYAAQGSITIQGLNPEAKVYLYNAVGQLIAQPQVKESSLLISEMPAGFYLIKISDFEGNHTYKLQL